MCTKNAVQCNDDLLTREKEIITFEVISEIFTGFSPEMRGLSSGSILTKSVNVPWNLKS